MSTTSSYKRCPHCDNQSSGSQLFCIECGASLAQVPALTGLVRIEQSDFSLPDYLRADQYRKAHLRGLLADETGSGSGLVWSGAILAAAAVIFTSMNSLGISLLAIGVLFVIAGFWRMRTIPEALGRSGLAIMALAVVALGAIVFQAVGTPRPVITNAAAPAAVAPVPRTESPAEPRTAARDTGIAMFGATADHSGVHPGPGPVGRPVTKWRQHTGGEVYSSPVVADDTVFVGTKSGFLAAYDLETGRERWRFDLGGYIVRATPAVVDGVVYIGAGYGLFAVDAGTGDELWRIPIRFAGAASPTVTNDTVFVATQEGHVYAIEAGTGEERWHYEADGLIFGPPAVSDGTVYFASDTGGIYAMSAQTGRLLWRHNADIQIRGAPAIGAGGVFFNSEQPALLAFAPANGDQLWTAGVGGEASPAVAADLVVFGGDENGLYAADATTGELRWLFPTGSPVVTAAAIAEETVYASSGATLYAIDLETGAATWTYPAGDQILTSAAVVDETVVFGSQDGFLYAISGDGAVEVDGS